MNKSLFNHKLFKALLAFLILFNCESNTDKKDTFQNPNKEVINDTVTLQGKKKVIAPKGNQIFENSKKLYNLKWKNGYILQSINISECDNSNTDEDINKLDKKIDSITINDDSFTIYYKAFENCCSEFLCEAEIINNDTLNLIYNAYGSHCFCNCLFNMSFQFSYNNKLDDIKVTKTKIKSIVFNNNLNSKVKFANTYNTK
ncbi:MAG: hypothetical protein Tsb0033_26880 [Winogradskyella sp.]